MVLKPRRLLKVFSLFFRLSALAFGIYILVIIGIVLWTFEYKFKRKPTFVYASPFSIAVGANIEELRLAERLKRCGYSQTDSAVPEPGQWSRAGSGINIFLKHCPFKLGAVVSGPISINLDWNRVKSIRLKRSQEDVQSVTLEPELISVVPAPGELPALRRNVGLDEIPAILIDSILLTEDTHFYSHQGIDFGSILDAIKANIKAGRYVQGGSTISQQLIRMTILNPEKTMARKINEAFLAMTADAVYSKKTILEAYLNRVYFGHWGQLPVHGVSEAATKFFGKSLKELDPADCALMAAGIRAPNIINPFRRPDRARARRNMVLGLLLKTGKIDREKYDEAINAPVDMLRHSMPHLKTAAFLELIKDSITHDATQSSDVITTLDPLIQNDAESELKKLDEHGIPFYFACLNVQNGALQSYFAPPPGKWAGDATSINITTPILLLPALAVDKQDRAKFSLATQVPATTHSSGTLTLRQAFRQDRDEFMLNIMSRIDSKQLIDVSSPFGFKLIPGEPMKLSPTSPLRVAQNYLTLANLGRRVSYRTMSTNSSDYVEEENRNIAVKPGALFLVNYLLKEMDQLDGKNGSVEHTSSLPSVFTTSDEEGSWLIAYNAENLIMLRAKTDRKDLRMKKIVETFFKPAAVNATKLDAPEGVVFRRICLQSGMRAVSICPKIISEPFLKGTQPDEWCSVRHDAESVRTELRK